MSNLMWRCGGLVARVPASRFANISSRQRQRDNIRTISDNAASSNFLGFFRVVAKSVELTRKVKTNNYFLPLASVQYPGALHVLGRPDIGEQHPGPGPPLRDLSASSQGGNWCQIFLHFGPVWQLLEPSSFGADPDSFFPEARYSFLFVF